MKLLSFSGRNAKEILRDPLTLFFGIGFPVILLLLLSAIQANVPVSLFEIEKLAPGITVFGLSFMTLFSATLISKDRETAFLQRLLTSPLSASDFILGYALPIIPISAVQGAGCYIVALFLGLKFSVNIIYAVSILAVISLFYIFMGLLCGSVFNVKQVGGICGALLTNLSAWLSGVWFDLDLVGGVFKKIAYLLPFVHAAELEKSVVAGNFSNCFEDFLWVLGYSAVFGIFAVFAFLKKTKK